jgi:hypothetical protein
VAATKPAGIESTLEVRVNDVLWRESDHLSDLGPKDRNYLTRRDNEGNTFVIFGNGERGARLPTGVENVKALYRQGIGKAGNVAGRSACWPPGLGVRTSLIRNRPPAAPSENIDSAKQNANVTLLALDLPVSVRGYRLRAPLPALARPTIRLSDGPRQLVHSPSPAPTFHQPELGSVSQLLQAFFASAIRIYRSKSRARALLIVVARMSHAAGILWEAVEPQIRARLLEKFALPTGKWVKTFC